MTDLGVELTFTGRDESLSQTALAIQRNIDGAAGAFNDYGAAARKSNAAILESARALADQKQALANNEAQLKAYATSLTQAEQAQRKIDAAVKQAGGSAQQAGTGFADFSKAALGAGAAFAGVTVGAQAARQALDDVVKSTLEANQAQRTLNATFGQSADIQKQFADQLAASTGQINAAVETGVARIGSLQKSFGVTSTEVQKLSSLSADLAAVFGGDLAEAFRSSQAGVRGEAESLEKYNIFVQDSAIKTTKAFQQLDPVLQKHWESLDEVTKARVRYRAIIEQAAQYEGEAKKRAEEADGGFDKLKRGTNELEVALGKQLVPILGTTAGALGKVASESAKATTSLGGLAETYRKFQTEQGNSLSTQLAADIVQLGVIQGLITNIVRQTAGGLGLQAIGWTPQTPTEPTGPMLGPSPQDVKAIQDQINAEIRDATKIRGQIAEQELRDAAERRKKDLDDQKLVLEARRDAELRAVDATKEARLKEIEDAAEAARAASEAYIAHLNAQKDAELRIVAEQKQARLDGIDAARQAADDAAEATVRRLRVEEAAQIKAADAQRDAVIRGLDQQKRAREDARIAEDRALRDDIERQKRAEDERHKAVLRGLEEEAEAAERARDRKIRALEAEEKAAEKRHEKRQRQYQAEERAAQQAHDATARRLDDELRAIDKVHDQRIRALDDERDAAQRAHDAEERRLSDLLQAHEDAHDERVRYLDDERRAWEDGHKATMRALEAELDTAQRAHAATVDRLEAETRAAKEAHDQRVRALSEEQERADDAHQATMRALDDERASRMGILDAQLKLLDAQERAADAQDKLAALQRAVLQAQQAVATATGSGTAAEIQRAQDALQRAYRVGDQRLISTAEGEYARLAGQGPQAVKAAQEQLAAAQKALLDEQTRQNRAAQRQQLVDQKDAIEEELDARKRAADDAYDLTKERIKAEKDAADAALEQVERVNDEQKRAADAELDRIRASVEARKQQADDALEQARRRIDGERQAADDALELMRRQVAAAKQANDDQFAKTKERIDQEKRVLDDALARERERIDAAKRANDDALTQARERIQQQQDAEAVAHDKTKDRIADRKLKVKDQYDDEIDKIGKRKLAEQDAHDKIVIAYQDTIQKKKDGVADARLAEDRADQDLREEANIARDEAIERTRQVYNDPETGLIPTVERAKDAVRLSFGQQRTDIEREAQAQSQAIQDTYTHQETGLIPLAQRAAAENQRKFRDMATDVQASAQAQKAAISDTYDSKDPANPGLITRLDNLKKQTDDALKEALKPWEDWQKGLVGENGVVKKTFDDAIEHFKRFTGELENGAKKPNENPGGRQGGPGGDSVGGAAAAAAGSAVARANSSAMDARGGGDGQDTATAAQRAFGAEISKDQSSLDVTMFGRKFSFELAIREGLKGKALLWGIERLGTQIGGQEFGRASAAIAKSEGAEGDLTKPGTGGARGPFQFDPGGELPNYARHLGKSVQEAGDFAGTHPMAAASWALHGYLGDTLREGLKEQKRGAELAEYGSRYGQRPYGDLWKRAGDAWRELYGELPRHEHGGWVPEPTILVNARTMRPTGTMSETGPEYIESVSESRGRANGTRGGVDEERLARAIARTLGPAIARTRPVNLVGTSEELVGKIRRQQARDAYLQGVRQR